MRAIGSRAPNGSNSTGDCLMSAAGKTSVRKTDTLCVGGVAGSASAFSAIHPT